jgi:hypothetical protein
LNSAEPFLLSFPLYGVKQDAPPTGDRVASIERRMAMTRRVSRLKGGEEAKGMETQRMVAVGEMPVKDREFEDLLRRAANFQKADSAN